MAEHNPLPLSHLAARARVVRCEDCECLIAEAPDGPLAAGDLAALELHVGECASCAEMLELASRGSAWLGLLKTGPEIPPGLLSRILVQTTGADAAAGLRANAEALQPWRQSALPAAHSARPSRFLMTAAMAFFSIALTLNLTSRQLSPARLSGLAPETLRSALTRPYYAAGEGMAKYYEDLPLVDEVRDLWRSAKPRPAGGQPGAPGSRFGAPKQPPNQPPNQQGEELRSAPGAALVAGRNRRFGNAEGSAA